MERKNKQERNLRIAKIDAETDDGRDPVDKLTNLGRSYLIAGKAEEALALFTQARELESESSAVWRTLFRAGAQAALSVNRNEEVLTWADDLASVSDRDDTSRYFRLAALVELRRWEEALDVSEGLTKMKDDDGVVFPQWIVDMHRAMAHAALEDWEAAAEEIAKVATVESHEEPIWALVVEAYWRTGRDIAALLRDVPAKHFPQILAQVKDAPLEATDRLLEAMYGSPEHRAGVLALAIRVAPRLAPERALEWSARLREHHLSEHCPLVVQAYDTQRPAPSRLRSAAIAVAAFGDERAKGALRLVGAVYPATGFAQALADLNDLAPVLLEPFIVSATTDAGRGFAMAKALHQLGASDEAVAVLQFGLGQSGGAIVAEQAAAWLDSVGHASEAELVRQGQR